MKPPPLDRNYLSTRTLVQELNRAKDALDVAARVSRGIPDLSPVDYHIRKAATYAGGALKVATRIYTQIRVSHEPPQNVLDEIDAIEREVESGIRTLERRFTHGEKK